MVVVLMIFLATAVRQIGRFRLEIWSVMLIGAGVVLFSGEIGPEDAWRAIDWDVLVFLGGLFVVGEGLYRSGYLATRSAQLFAGAKNTGGLVARIVLITGGLSALLMNDTVAIIATPLMIHFSRVCRVDVRLLLLALAFSITTGSVLSPVGNPQNLLIAVQSGMPDAFGTFLAGLILPTLLALGLVWGVLRLGWRMEYSQTIKLDGLGHIADTRLARASSLGVALALAAIAVRMLAAWLGEGHVFPLSLVALVAAAPVMLFSGQRFVVLRNMDWRTLVFFAAMFVVMQSVWESGFFQGLMRSTGLGLNSVEGLLGSGILVSQLVSNVPFVALILPAMSQAGAGTAQYLALAAGSTLAGNFLILGAASNIIVLQNAERHGAGFSFWEFARAGIPLTLLQAALYWAWFSLAI